MADLTDLEITRLCAQAMGLEVVMQLGQWRFPNTQHEDSLYDPKHNNDQCMELVKHMDMPTIRYTNQWIVSGWYSAPKTGMYLQAEATHDTDLNRAICLCVARMEQERSNG